MLNSAQKCTNTCMHNFGLQLILLSTNAAFMETFSLFFSAAETLGEKKKKSRKYHCSEYEDSFLSQLVTDPILKHGRISLKLHFL